MCESGRDGLTAQLLVIVCLSLRWRYMAEQLQQALVIEPATHPSGANSTASRDFPGVRRWMKLSLVKPVDGLGKGVIVTSALATQRRLMPACAGARCTLSIHSGSRVALVDQLVSFSLTCVLGLLQRIGHEVGPH